tara:strand:+ start:386 stop:937 length:552 start_codon:yes stop_codon:yes gene_type:complete
MAGFWAQPTIEPKRQFRFILQLDGIDAFTIKSVKKPGFTISEYEHKYLNHTFYYPGRLTWNEIEFTLVDPVDPDMASALMNKLTLSGYQLPTDEQRALQSTISKARAVGALGLVTIKQLAPPTGGGGLGVEKVVEQWELNNAWVRDVTFGDLSYDSEDATEISVTLRYDFAEYRKTNEEASQI